MVQQRSVVEGKGKGISHLHIHLAEQYVLVYPSSMPGRGPTVLHISVSEPNRPGDGMNIRVDIGRYECRFVMWLFSFPSFPLMITCAVLCAPGFYIQGPA